MILRSNFLIMALLLSSMIVIPSKYFSQIEILGCGVELIEGSGKYENISCGTEFIATKKDGTQWKCICDCSSINSGNCVQINTGGGSTASTNNTAGPTPEELNIYYNQQWTSYLQEQANAEFIKGKKLYENGDCKKAAKKFDNARKFATHYIYDQYYNLAIECVNRNVTEPTYKPATIPINSGGRREGLMKLTEEDSIVNEIIKLDQEKLNKNTAAYVDQQIALINSIRDNSKNQSADQITLALRKAEEDHKKMEALSPKNFSNLAPGDVILIGPDEKNLFSKGQAYLDAMTVNANSYVTHTLTCVRVVGEGDKQKRIFLDNQGDEGPRLISEDEMKKRYGSRNTQVAKLRDEPWGVAQPVSKSEADGIWEMAKRLAEKNENNPQGFMTKNNYGLWGDDQIVCSEASWMLVNVTGRYKIPLSDSPLVRTTGITFTPGSFFKYQEYFLITKLDLNK